MCATCGCGQADVRVGAVPGDSRQEHQHPHHDRHDGHHHQNSHDHDHGHNSGHGHARAPVREVVDIETALLAKNDDLARRTRSRLAERGIVALNLMSSPGSGKTSLLCRTITELAADRPVAVIEGDQETRIDAEKIRGTGAPVVQINTGSGCHLDADMVARGLAGLEPATGSIVFVENVGNLVCPALFDLGEAARVVVVSVTEGEDKPLKYPQMFAAADVVVINKIDLLPYVDVELDRLAEHCRAVNPGVTILPVSVTTGAGMDDWRTWLTGCRPH
jgi:hydrogenase nickel incorporation protein HypB